MNEEIRKYIWENDKQIIVLKFITLYKWEI